jgi:L-alanine-DL-glutamate epimerase-like enolase superfamily enzyme
MKITDIRVTVLKPLPVKLEWKEQWPPREIQNDVITVATGEGIEGYTVTWFSPPGEWGEALPELRGGLARRDPWDIEAIWYETHDVRLTHNLISSAIDICLWDILGKKTGLPIYKLLGAFRNKIRAYASTIVVELKNGGITNGRTGSEDGSDGAQKQGHQCPIVHRMRGVRGTLSLPGNIP